MLPYSIFLFMNVNLLMCFHDISVLPSNSVAVVSLEAALGLLTGVTTRPRLTVGRIRLKTCRN